MGYVLYSSQENNGTFVPVGRIHMALSTPAKCYKFRKSVVKNRMYSTFVTKNLWLMWKMVRSSIVHPGIPDT